MRGKFAGNPDYVEYETLLQRLHELNATGKGDSEEADARRDEMDGSARELGEKEVARLQGLSADLRMLQDDEVFEPLEPGEDPAERAPERRLQQLRDVWARGDAEAALKVLRKGACLCHRRRSRTCARKPYE